MEDLPAERACIFRHMYVEIFIDKIIVPNFYYLVSRDKSPILSSTGGIKIAHCRYKIVIRSLPRIKNNEDSFGAVVCSGRVLFGGRSILSPVFREIGMSKR